MNRLPNLRAVPAAGLSLLLLATSHGGAGESVPPALHDGPAVALAPSAPPLREEIELRYSYAGDADLRSGAGGKLGGQTAQFAYGVTVPVDDRLSFQGGFDYHRSDFGLPAGSPLPDSLQSLSLSAGAAYKLSDQWELFGNVAPRLDLIDGWDHIQSQNLQIGGALGATYQPRAALSLRFGLALNPGTLDTPVLPILGLRWKFAPLWTLRFGFPRTAIDYQLMNLRLSPLEASFNGGLFHTGRSYGDAAGRSALNDRKLDYHEIRLGAGADYALEPNVDIALSAGVIAYREFDFQDAGYSPKADPAPYVQFGVKVGF